MPDVTPNFRLRWRLDGDRLELAAAGELDMAATFRLEPELDGLLADGDVRSLVWDLGEVTFIDSAGLGALLSIRERAQQLGVGMTLVRVSDPVRRVIHVSGLASALGA